MTDLQTAILFVCVIVWVLFDDWITARLVRVRWIWIRVPLWLLWFPMMVLGDVVDAILHGHWRRLLRPAFREWTVNCFFVGLFGTLVGMEITR
jgi:hypothetical protein